MTSPYLTWVSHWLPFRPSATVYANFAYGELPPVDCSEYDRYKTADDVRRDPPQMVPSPLFSEWRFDLPGMFMRDSTFGISWSTDERGRVVILGLPGYLVVVAAALSEFLARMALENSIWWAVVDNELEELARDGRTDPQRLWNVLQPVLSEGQLAYLRPYYEGMKKLRAAIL